MVKKKPLYLQRQDEMYRVPTAELKFRLGQSAEECGSLYKVQMLDLMKRYRPFSKSTRKRHLTGVIRY